MAKTLRPASIPRPAIYRITRRIDALLRFAALLPAPSRVMNIYERPATDFVAEDPRSLDWESLERIKPGKRFGGSTVNNFFTSRGVRSRGN